jgi:dTDP-4-amino-4,6-dideoxy-D-galactose acyltransferase
MHNTQLLAWDTDILGVSVAKIISPKLNTADLLCSLQTLKKKGVKLVYWCIDSNDPISKQAAIAYEGFLADEKITYTQELTNYTYFPFPYQDVEIYIPDEANHELESIAMEISQFSRFSIDPKLTAEQAKRLYKKWIHNSCQKIVAKIVLIIKKNNNIVGMVTIDEKQGHAALSLVGVLPSSQGQGIGKRLVYAAIAWSLKQNYTVCQVVTQKSNFKARRLYEKCGFIEEKLQYFYHFWL